MAMMQVNQAYDEWAAQYDTNRNRTRDLEAVALREVLQHYAFEEVLELGCGTGKNTGWLAERSKAVVAMDFSREMLALARKKLEGAQVAFLECDLTKDWPVPANCADLLSCSLTLEHIEDLDDIFRKVAACLRPGGHFFLCELHPCKQYVGSQARFDRGAERVEVAVHVHHMTDYLRAAEAAGLTLVDLQEWFDDSRASGERPRLVSFVFKQA